MKWFIFVMLMLFTPVTYATDWPMFGRDPQHTGVASESVELPLEVQCESKTISSVLFFLSMSSDTVYVGADYICAECRNGMSGCPCAKNIMYVI